MKIHFLGTLGWYDTRLGNTLSVLVDTQDAYIVFDCGSGFYKLDRFIKEDKPIIVLLSHFHLDHIIGLHALAKFNFKQKVRIFGPPGVKRLFGLVIRQPYTMAVDKLKMQVTVQDFSDNLKLPVDIVCQRLRHVGVCFGYRLSAEGKVIAFCTDTGICKNLEILAAGADLLIAESSLPAGKIDNSWPHLNPQQAAKIAQKAKAKKLILAHFDASIYLNGGDIIAAQTAARRIFKNTQASRDGLTLKL